MTDILFQCRLVRAVAPGVTAVVIGWIPERAAVVGKCVELLSEDGEFWEVTHVYKIGMEAPTLHEKQRRDRGSLSSLVPA